MKKINLLILAITVLAPLSLLAATKAPTPVKTNPMAKVVTIEKNTKDGPLKIIKRKNGNLVALFKTVDNTVYLQQSKNNGKTWQKIQTKIKAGNDATQTIDDLIENKNGELIILGRQMSYAPDTKPEDAIKIYTLKSKDGITWTNLSYPKLNLTGLYSFPEDSLSNLKLSQSTNGKLYVMTMVINKMENSFTAAEKANRKTVLYANVSKDLINWTTSTIKEYPFIAGAGFSDNNLELIEAANTFYLKDSLAVYQADSIDLNSTGGIRILSSANGITWTVLPQVPEFKDAFLYPAKIINYQNKLALVMIGNTDFCDTTSKAKYFIGLRTLTKNKWDNVKVLDEVKPFSISQLSYHFIDLGNGQLGWLLPQTPDLTKPTNVDLQFITADYKNNISLAQYKKDVDACNQQIQQQLPEFKKQAEDLMNQLKDKLNNLNWSATSTNY